MTQCSEFQCEATATATANANADCNYYIAPRHPRSIRSECRVLHLWFCFIYKMPSAIQWWYLQFFLGCLFISSFHLFFCPAYICRIVRRSWPSPKESFVCCCFFFSLSGARRFRARRNSIGCPYLVLWQMLYVIIAPLPNESESGAFCADAGGAAKRYQKCRILITLSIGGGRTRNAFCALINPF